MSEQEKLQREACGIQFKEIFRRLDAVEKSDKELQEGKIDKFTEAIIRYEMLFSKQEDTIKGIMDKFDEYRRENVEVGKQRDEVIRELSANVMKTTEGLVKINDQQKALAEKIEKVSDDIKAVNEKTKIDYQVVGKNIFITLFTGSTVSFISFLIYTYIKSL